MKQKQSNSVTMSRKDEIIRASAKIFASKGYHATTLDEIAREIGVTKPAIYYHISNKAVLRETAENLKSKPQCKVIRDLNGVGCIYRVQPIDISNMMH